VSHSAFCIPHSALIDTHAHLDAEEFNGDREETIARAQAAGVVAMICPGIDAGSSEAAVRLAAGHEGIFAAVGIQPNCCAAAAEGDWERIVALVAQAKVVSIGETGLARHWDYTPSSTNCRGSSTAARPRPTCCRCSARRPPVDRCVA